MCPSVSLKGPKEREIGTQELKYIDQSIFFAYMQRERARERERETERERESETEREAIEKVNARMYVCLYIYIYIQMHIRYVAVCGDRSVFPSSSDSRLNSQLSGLS